MNLALSKESGVWLRFGNYIVALGMGAYAMFLRLSWLAQKQGLYDADEQYQLARLNSPFIELLAKMPEYEFTSYLNFHYYLIYPFFRAFGQSKWLLNIPNIIFTVMGFYFLYLLCRRYLKTPLGYFIAFSAPCLNYTLIKYSGILRSYAYMPALGLMSLYFTHVIITDYEKLSRIKKILFGALCVLIIWFHVYGIVMVACAAIFHLSIHWRDVSTQKKAGKLMKFAMIVLLVAMPLWLYSVMGSQVEYGTEVLGARGVQTFQFIPNPLIKPVGFLKGVLGNLMGDRRIYFLLLGAVSPFILPYKDRYKHIAFLGLMVITPIVFILLADLKNGYWFIQRQFVWVAPLLCLYLALSWEALLEYGNEWLRRKLIH